MDGERLRFITDAILCAASQTATQQQRAKSYEVCESFKSTAVENSELLFTLLDQGRDDRVRHYALQVIEHIIKHCWNNIPTDSKLRLKTLCMSSIQQVCDKDPVYISDGIAKCTVEIAKRDWPQQWPTFIDEMSSICAQNQPEKTKLVMRTLLRLAEDVVMFNKLQPQRRKDIQSALNKAVVTIVPFLVQTLEASIELCKREASTAHLQLTKCTLETIMGYVGWCDAALVNSYDNKLISLLFANLSEGHIQLPCVECLLVIAHRHGNAESLSPVLVMFYEHSLGALQQVLMQASGSCMDLATHTFLKRLTQFIISMGEQLCTMLTREGKQSKAPSSFTQYVQILLLLTDHHSLFITSECFDLWTTLLRANTPLHLATEAMIELSKLCLKKLQKVGSPSLSLHPSSYYSKLDFDSESDWQFTYNKSKSCICTVLLLMKSHAEKELIDITMDEIAKLYKLSLQSGAEQLLSDETSELYLQWQAANVFLHAVTKDMTLTSDPRCVSTFQLFLQAQTQICELLELMLSVLSALFPVVNSLPQPMFDLLLEKIFAGVQYSQPSTPPVKRKNLSRHAGIIFIKLADTFPTRLVPKFFTLHNLVAQSRQCVDNRTFRYLMEGLLIISNKMHGYERQVEYIQLILSESVKKWKDEKLQQAFHGPLEMASYIGLLSAPNSDPLFQERRYQMQELVRDFLIVARRVSSPSNKQAASSNGYTDKNGVVQSPSFDVLAPYFKDVLLCMHSTLGLFKEVTKKQFHPDYPPSAVHELPDCERAQITGLMVDDTTAADVKRHTIEKHVLDMLDSINQLLVLLCRISPNQFFTTTMADNLSCIIANHVKEVNSFTLKNLLKTLLKPLYSTCPAELAHTFVTPLLFNTLPPIVSRLSSSWQQVESFPQTDDGEEKPEEEIVENELLRLSSRQLMEICVGLFIESLDHKPKAPQPVAGDDVEMADSTEAAPTAHAGNEAEVTQFVKNLPQENVLFLLEVSTTCSCWADSLVSQKSIDLVHPLTKYLLSAGVLKADICEQVLRSLLTSVHMHGHHDYLSVKLLTCVVSVYELLRAQFPDNMVGIMLQVPGVSPENLQQYEHDTGIELKAHSAPPKRMLSAKAKRDKLKVLISEIVGKHISEQFKENVVISNLPPLVKRKLKKSDLISDVSDNDTLGLCSLFAAS